MESGEQGRFGDLRGLLARVAQEKGAREELLSLMKEVQAEDHARFREQWVPYLLSQEVLHKVPLTTVTSIGELEELADLFPFAFFAMDVLYHWHRRDWFVDLARCREMTQVLFCVLCGNDFHDEDALRLAGCRRLSNLRHLDITETFSSQRGIDALESSPFLKPTCEIVSAPYDETNWRRRHFQRVESPSDSDHAVSGIQNFGATRDLYQAANAHLSEILAETEKCVNSYLEAQGFLSLDEFPSLFRLTGHYYIDSIQLLENSEVWVTCYLLGRRTEAITEYMTLEFCWAMDPWSDELFLPMSVTSGVA